MSLSMEIASKFLKKLKESQLPASIYLTNGVQLQGTIDDFDGQTLVLTNSSPQLVYLHAIASIMPKRQRFP